MVNNRPTRSDAGIYLFGMYVCLQVDFDLLVGVE